jgi:hypothetical protein
MGEKMENADYAPEAGVFFRVQVSRYLSAGARRDFSSDAERDAVLAMIADAWVELRSSGCLDGRGPAGRMAIYATCLIVFPTFVASREKNLVTVDFQTGRRISPRSLPESGSPEPPRTPGWPSFDA